jgi:hypothetical protein
MDSSKQGGACLYNKAGDYVTCLARYDGSPDPVWSLMGMSLSLLSVCLSFCLVSLLTCDNALRVIIM